MKLVQMAGTQTLIPRVRLHAGKETQLTWGAFAQAAGPRGVHAEVRRRKFLGCQVRKRIQRHLQQCSDT